jgi:hypothetical protein
MVISFLPKSVIRLNLLRARVHESNCTRRGKKILYRGLGAAAMLAWVISSAAWSEGQEGTPEITSLEKKVVVKKDLGPRAIALLQMSSNGKATLVPVAIEIDGKFWDASSYKASPVPMAIEGGTVYEGVRTGSSVGLFTVNSALHSLAVNTPNPWIATGTWLPAGTAAPKTGMKAEIVPVGIETTDAPPRLTKSPAQTSAPETSAPPATTTSAPASTSAPTSSPAPASTAPPAQTPAGSSAPPSTSTPTTGSSGSAPPGANPPAQDSKTPPASDGGKTNEQAKAQAPAQNAPAAAAKDKDSDAKNKDDGPPADPNRPRLRRGKPVMPLPDDDVPGYAKPGVKGAAATKAASDASSAGASSTTPAAAPAKDVIDTVLAVSDAQGPDPRPYTFEWGKDELAVRNKQMVDMAKEQIRAYLLAQAKREAAPQPMAAKPTAKTGATKTAPRAPIAKIPQPIIENVRLRTFDVWTNNQPVMVMSADAHLPPAVGTNGASAEPLQYSITLVARTDIYNNLHKIYAGITDKYHLDVTPRLELIDAVDADGDGRGEFFFRETSDIGSGYVIYRPTADSLWKMFDSLNRQ